MQLKTHAYWDPLTAPVAGYILCGTLHLVSQAQVHQSCICFNVRLDLIFADPSPVEKEGS